MMVWNAELRFICRIYTHIVLRCPMIQELVQSKGNRIFHHFIKGSSMGSVMSFRWLNTSLSKDFMTSGQWACSHLILWWSGFGDWDDGGALKAGWHFT